MIDTELVKKVIRCSVVGMLFIAMMTLQGIVDQRQAHQMVFMVASISLFGLIIRNIWVTMFLLWTVFLYSFFKFSGGNYLTNVFFGCVFYLIVKVAFKKEHINFFINGFLWFVAANILFMVLQVSGLDFILKRLIANENFARYFPNDAPRGFMGHPSIMGTMAAFAVPLLASRGSKWAMAGAILMFYPLYVAKTSLCFLMGMAGLLFVLYFKIPRKVWIGLIAVVFLCGTFYIKKVDKPGTERFVAWKQIMNDAMIHPITGWGLDSFANVTDQKNWRYTNSITGNINHFVIGDKQYHNVKNIQWWDNPHNLLISLLYEWGFPALVLSVGYHRFLVKRFQGAIRSPNLIGLAGFIVVFLGISMGHFPIFLARLAPVIVGVYALYEVETS